MNSLTMTPQGPASGRRQGRSRACSSNHAMTGECSAWEESVDTAGEEAGDAVMADGILARFASPGAPDRGR